MSTQYAVAIEGLSELRNLDTLPKSIATAALRAINRTTERTATEARRRIREQVAFPAQYLTGVDGSGRQRLGVTQKARAGNLEAVITGRFRATSLARFVTRGAVGTRGGVSVQVAPGFARLMRRAFLIRLPAGRGGDIETKANLGVAIRLKPGESIANKHKAVQMHNGAYLLFGPSVDQVFRTVRGDVTPDTLDYLEAEFSRLLELELPT